MKIRSSFGYGRYSFPTISGHRVPALVQPITGGQERLVGRDVLNQHRVTFDGPAGLVTFAP
jgi:hypothetical protein